MLCCHNEKCYKENGSVSLLEDDVDDRSEWCVIYYHCDECGTSYERKMTYKTQSSLVESDILYMIDEKGNSIEVE